VLDTCLLSGRQTTTEWIMCSAIHRLFSLSFSLAQHSTLCPSYFIWVTQHIVQPCNITTITAVILCNN
jgi:hypothetical protein